MRNKRFCFLEFFFDTFSRKMISGIGEKANDTSRLINELYGGTVMRAEGCSRVEPAIKERCSRNASNSRTIIGASRIKLINGVVNEIPPRLIRFSRYQLVRSFATVPGAFLLMARTGFRSSFVRVHLRPRAGVLSFYVAW